LRSTGKRRRKRKRKRCQRAAILVSIATILTSNGLSLGDVQVARPIDPDASELRSNVYVYDYAYVYA